MADRVTVRLGWSFGYRDPEDRSLTYYGPGLVEVPVALARSLGLQPVETSVEEQVPLPLPPLSQPNEPVALPEDFPHADVLADNGITTYEAVPTTEEALVALSGIGPKRATDIITALVEAGYGV